jgi:DeoR/GlpR family transcriptional regulator of sugar metabolism
VLAAERRSQILEQLQRHGAVRVGDLTELFGVSDMTIRRDLDTLAREGLAHKVYGGATLTRESATTEPGFEAKWSAQQREKEAIAREAAQLVAPGSAVGLSAGTTTWTLAHELREIPGLTVVTNSIRVASVLHGGSSEQTVVITGGVRTPSDALVGPVAVSALEQLHLDVVFMGVHGMQERAGFSTPNLLEADLNRMFVRSARRLVVVADHTKWGMLGISTIAALADAHLVVSDVRLPSEGVEALERAGTDLVLASVDGARAWEA